MSRPSTTATTTTTKITPMAIPALAPEDSELELDPVYSGNDEADTFIPMLSVSCMREEIKRMKKKNFEEFKKNEKEEDEDFDDDDQWEA